MKRVSCKMFFTVVWKGICQTVGGFFGVFGYKREGKFARFVWGVFAVSASIFMACLACVALYGLYTDARYELRKHTVTTGRFVSSTIDFYADYYGSNGYLKNKATNKKVLTGIDWIAMPAGQDSLVCFSNGKLRGYFHARTGEVVIKPQYKHAWIFSEGLAAVEDGGLIKFIDATGKVVIDKGMAYRESVEEYVFHGGYHPVWDENTKLYGLMDKAGHLVLKKEYDQIELSNSKKYWEVSKDNQTAVYDKDLHVILPFIEGRVFLCDECIDVTMADHTMRKYDYQGNLINDFYITQIQMLTYETGETYYDKGQYTDENDETHTYQTEKKKEATAHLRAYHTDSHKGLITAEGHVVTMPLYEDIEAIGPDTYLCTVCNGDKVIVDGKGQLMR